MKLLKTAAIGLLLFIVAGVSQAGRNLRRREEKRICSMRRTYRSAGFSIADSKGQWTGLDVDLCKAVAAMMFGDAKKFKAVTQTTQQRFTALQSGEVDVLTRNTTATLTRDTTLG